MRGSSRENDCVGMFMREMFARGMNVRGGERL